MTTAISFGWRVLAVLAGAGLALAPAAAGAAQEDVPLQPAVEIGLPPGAAPANDWIEAVSCPQAGSCTAGGFDDGHASQAMIVTESKGHWHTPRTLVMPPEGKVIPPGQITDVTCASPGNCVAVGSYLVFTNGDGSAPFIDIESNGKWSVARRVKLPPGYAVPKPFSVLDSVSCQALGSCVAVGIYKDHLGHRQPMWLAESNGKWTQATRLSLPVNANKNTRAAISSVSCRTAGQCVAVGSYADATGSTQTVVFSRSNGKWHRGTEVKLPADAATDPHAGLVSVSCPAKGSCTVVGYYQSASTEFWAMTLTVVAGKPSTAQALTVLPADAAAQPTPSLTSVTCPAAGACIAVGEYLTNAGSFEPMIITQASGQWTSAARIDPPPDAFTVGQVAVADGVSCTPGGYCAVVGLYQTTTADRSFAATTK
jgi:hypothetical protein